MNCSYELKLDFDKDSNAINVFTTLLDLQNGIEEYNKALIGCISSDIKVSSVLLDIDKGSIKTFFQDNVKKLPDNESIERFIDKPKDVVKDQIKNLLKNGRKKLIEIAYIDELTQLEKEDLLCEETKELIENSELSAYGSKISKEKILTAAEQVYKPIRESKNDIYFVDNNIPKKLNKDFEVNLKNTFKETTETNTFTAMLIIKKPDIVGSSKWEMVYNKSIDVEIKDRKFIEKIKNREIPILSGDRLECKFKSVITYNDDYEVIESKYYILEVYNVKAPNKEENTFI